MNKYKLGFVILHYHVIDETIRCVESIISQIDTKNYSIVIVDNASTNGTGKELKEKYRDNKKVHVLLNDKNLGFSKGNNVGFKYAKEKLKCDFICMTNNDTEIIQNNFFETILKEYEKSNFAVLGPEIHLLDGTIFNYRKRLFTLEEIETEKKRMHKNLFLNYTFIESIILSLKSGIKKLIRWDKIKEKNPKEEKLDGRLENVWLHGCCLIFSPIYINIFDGLEEKTFFYGEESFLFIRLLRNNMKNVYCPDVKIFHAEKASTSAVTGKNYKKRRFVYQSHLNSLHLLKEDYLKDLESIRNYIF